MINSSLSIPVAAVATAATIIYIGLGFLPRPSRAAALWSTAFAVAMLAGFGYVAAETLDSQLLRGGSSALLLTTIAVVWAGLRAHRGARRTFAPLALVLLVVVPGIQLLTVGTSMYGITFRTLFCVTAVFAGLTIFELLRLGTGVRDEVMPLVAVTTLYIAFAGIQVVNGVLVMTGAISFYDGLMFIRTVNMLGATMFLVCALVTLLLLTVLTDRGALHASQNDFEVIARTRLRRAQNADDQWWSLLDIRLDDAEDIRAAAGTAAFTAATERFAQEVDAALPADADFVQLDATRFLVLLPRAQGGVREILISVLTRVSAQHEGYPALIRLSASIGWAQVAALGYDLDVLRDAAAEAAVTAHEDGGDRWERVRVES